MNTKRFFLLAIILLTALNFGGCSRNPAPLENESNAAISSDVLSDEPVARVDSLPIDNDIYDSAASIRTPPDSTTSIQKHVTESEQSVIYPSVINLNPSSNQSEPRSSATQAELDRYIVEFQKYINSIKLEDVQKLEILFSSYNNNSTQTTTDPQLISQWFEFFKDFELSAYPHADHVGVGIYLFYYYDHDGNKYFLLNGPLSESKPLFQFDQSVATLVVDNFDEAPFRNLLSRTGF